jgi:type IX secretion system PorP/SprF family membrane protein
VKPDPSHIFLFLLQVIFLPVCGQDFHFSGFMNNQAYYNPAYAAVPEMNEFSMTYRNQWPGIPASFVTYGVTFIQPFSVIKSGIGVVFLRDVEAGGVISRSSASLMYGYSFKASRTLHMVAGIGASYVYRQFDPSTLVFASDLLNELGTPYPPADISAYAKGYPDFSVGWQGEYKKDLTLGISAAHVTRPKESFSAEPADRLPVKYSLYSSYAFRTGGRYNRNGIDLTPSLLYVHQGKTNELVWGTAARINPMTAGIWLRNNLTLNFSSLIFSIGILQKKYTFLYNYDVNLTSVNFLSTKTGAHEVTFLFRFEYKKKKHKAVNCPT